MLELTTTLCMAIAFWGDLLVKAMIVILPTIAAAYLVHAVCTRKPLKQIWKEIKP